MYVGIDGSGFHGVQSGVSSGRGGAGGGWGPRFGFCGIDEVRGGVEAFGRAPGVAVGSGVSSGSAEAAAGVGGGAAAVGEDEGEAVADGLALVLGVGEPDFSGAGDAPSEQPPSSRPPASSAVTDIGTLP
ncbi:hypothetical protein [Streptomyces sp. NBC_01443]|uniref:hypothetical protein n=1 Tax=Streptomyces sp. NBC_01443 TaxID=2903868 RepID=UPI002258E613|nr:hypothetical protein [Streptomyces sp. NBC_01443]MCX4631649.1 hypothetical protein [Streptomyces sp. NBC_01443]